MIIIQVAGGLGNQLQQYALYEKFRSLGREAKLDISWFTQPDRQQGVYAKRELELNYFENLPYEICTEAEKQALVGNGGLLGRIKGRLLPDTKKVFHETGMYHPEIFDYEDKYLCGYWACEKYYADILDILREKIRFPMPEDTERSIAAGEGKAAVKENKKLAERMRQEESVSIHIRRGDYLDAENAAMFGGICTEEYYEGAIRAVKRIHPQAHFYLFSDDAAYVKENYLGEEYTAVDINKGKSSFYDIWLMSNCRHNICANSTFSFWGARLNANPEKLMIRPSVHKNSQVYEPERMHVLWKGWMLLNNEGETV